MAYFAELDENNKVIRTIVAESKEWCETHLGGTWVSAEQDGKWACPNWKYHADQKRFSVPRPNYKARLNARTLEWIDMRSKEEREASLKKSDD